MTELMIAKTKKATVTFSSNKISVIPNWNALPIKQYSILNRTQRAFQQGDLEKAKKLLIKAGFSEVRFNYTIRSLG